MSLFHPMLATSIILATAALAAGQVDVRSLANCPSSQEIAERLRPLLPDRNKGAPDIATVEVLGSMGTDMHVRIRLVRANGSEVGDRRILLQRDCAEAAATVATVIAAWETEPFVPTAPSSSIVPKAPPASAVPAATARANSTPPSTWQLLVGAGGGVGLVGGVAGIGRLEVAVGPSASRLQARFGGSAESVRTAALLSGQVDWQHSTFEAGLLVRTLAPVWLLSLDAGLVLGWATLEGRRFSQNRKQRSFEYGGMAAVRLGRRLGRWSVWAESRAYAWALGQRASLPSENASIDLPLVDLTAGVGVSTPSFW